MITLIGLGVRGKIRKIHRAKNGVFLCGSDDMVHSRTIKIPLGTSYLGTVNLFCGNCWRRKKVLYTAE